MSSPARNFDDPKWINLRRRVFRRDKHRCKWCGKVGKRGKTKKGTYFSLQAHHIKTWAAAPLLRFEISNLITLCQDCHKKVWGKEEQYEMLFKNMLRQTEGNIESLLYLLEKKFNNDEETEE